MNKEMIRDVKGRFCCKKSSVLGKRRKNFAGLNLERFDFSGRNLSKANFRRSNLAYANFEAADVQLANFDRAILTGASFQDSNLSFAKFNNANLLGAMFRGSKLYKAKFNGADMTSVKIQDSDISYASFTNVKFGENCIENVNASGMNLSGSTGLISSADFLDRNFEKDSLGIIVYKTIGYTEFNPPKYWNIKPGSFLEEEVNRSVFNDCACGVNVATLGWIKKHYLLNLSRRGMVIWKCRIRFMDLADTIVPLGSDGKIRAKRVELLEIFQ